MTQLQRGQRVPLSALITSSTFELHAKLSGDAQEYDVACFLLNEHDKVLSDAHIVFYNQEASPDGSVRYASVAGEARFTVDLTRVDYRVHKMVLTITPDGGELRGVRQGEIRILQGSDARASYTFSGADFPTERAIMALELYKRNGEWRAAAVGQGFNGGLAALVSHFGSSVSEPPAPSAPPTPPAPPASPPVVDVSRPRPPAPAAPTDTRIDTRRPESAPPAGPPVSLTKVTLHKQGDSARISLTKGQQVVHVNLNWTQQAARGGFFGRAPGSADLDLGCMFEMEDGSRGVMQALGRNLGRSGTFPFIYIDQDDRSGVSANGENLYVEKPELIRRVLIFAFIYQGTSNFRDVNAHMTLKDTAGNEVKLNLDNPSSSATFCAVALLEKQGSQLSVRKEERYFPGHKQCDEHYDFGFQWTRGSK